HLEQLAFSDEDIDYLRSRGSFRDDFLAWLRAFRFTGDVFAIQTGTPLFANEPIMEIVAPIASAQFVETVVMNQIHVQTVLASKAARIVTGATVRACVCVGPRPTAR